MRRYFFITVLLASFFASSCDSMKDDSERRAIQAASARGDILIGAVVPWSLHEQLWPGIELALKEINSSGGVSGRKIKIVKRDDHQAVSEGRMIAQKFAEDLNIVAVLGHFNSYVSVPVSYVYSFAGILMVAPYSTSPALTSKGLKRVFRTIPNDKEVARKLADYTFKKGYRKIIICYVNDLYGLGLANSYEDRIEEIAAEDVDAVESVSVVERVSYDTSERRELLRTKIRSWKPLEFDAVLLVGEPPKVVRVLNEIRNMGIDVPVFGGDGLGRKALTDIAGERAEGVVSASFYNPYAVSEKTKQFQKAFKESYGVPPDTFAVQGYDALHLLAAAIRKAGSAVPDKIAEALKSMKGWQGVAGKYSFDEHGDLKEDHIFLKRVENGKFIYDTDEQ